LRQLNATRTELMARRARIELAGQGRDLLKDKRAALMRELHGLAEQAIAGSDQLERRAAEGHAALAEAIAFEGPEAVGSAALAASGAVELQVETRNVAGVRLVAVHSEGAARPLTGRGYSLTATTPHIDRVARLHEQVVDLLLETSPVELSVARLAAEISRTTRRINALEHVVLPRLEGERDYIAAVLNEREREDQVRLRRAKAATTGARA
jgi:V/A-type H+/Na+-transporting ATPase subunit D